MSSECAQTRPVAGGRPAAAYASVYHTASALRPIHPRRTSAISGRLRRAVRVGYTAGGRFPQSSLSGPVAQGIEQWFPKPCVGGSNPLGATHYQPAWILPLRLSASSLVIPSKTPLTAYLTAYPRNHSCRHSSYSFTHRSPVTHRGSLRWPLRHPPACRAGRASRCRA